MNKIEHMQQKLRHLLQLLIQQAQQCETLPLEQKQRYFPLQEPNYITSSYELCDYTQELSLDLQRLEEHIQNNSALQGIEFLCLQLSTKFKQLHYALNKLQKSSYSRPKKHKTKVAPQLAQLKSSSSLYQKLQQQQDFERQLEDKIRARQNQLKDTPGSSTQLQNEILILKQRLGRCKQATYQVENAIVKFEKGQ